MNQQEHVGVQGNSSHHRYHCCRYRSSTSAPAGDGVTAKIKWGLRWFWHLLLQNRLAIFIASLFWLLCRSGAQPRRLSYPCQQVAAFNVGAFIAGLIPITLLLRRRRGEDGVPKAVVVRRQLVAAAIMCVAAFAAFETYQFADTLLEAAAVLPNVPPPPVEPPPALVGIAHKPYNNWRAHAGETPPPRPPYTVAEINTLVERAIRLAGGLDDIMTDKVVDGKLRIVLKPNLVNTVSITTYPENGLVTDPRVVAAVVQEVKLAAARKGFASQDVEIIIADGTAGPDPWDDPDRARRDITMVAFQKCGYDANSDGLFDYDSSVTFSDLNDCGTGSIYPTNSPPDPANPPPLCSAVWIENAVMRRQLWVPNVLLNCDVLISIPTLKNHSNGDVTMALKNRVGCAPADIYHTIHEVIPNHGNQMKHKLHFSQCPWYPSFGEPWNLDRGNLNHAYPAETTDENAIVNYMIVDLNLVRPQDFAVVDGLVGIMNGPAPAISKDGNGNYVGPDYPNPHMQMVFAGRDSVAVDTVGALMMGYDPEYVRYLRWGYNRQLGTMDRGKITVVGDHVAMWRYTFEDNWADGSRHAPNGAQAETSPPTLFGISTPENGNLVNNDKITVSGFMDNVGVVRAEAAVAILGPNLLTNGNFELGTQTGWTKWWAGWGTAGNSGWNFSHTGVGPMGGQYCLRLGDANTNCSFGVYQEVPVTPGKTYRLDAYWKGKKLGDMNWFEVNLIDGPFDMQQADQDPYARYGYMYAYDNNTYALPGAIGTTFGWIWCHSQNAPPKNQVDWNNRLGRRTASGNVMTVVLKAGTVDTGVECYFDNVVFSEVSEDYVVAAVANPTAGVELEPLMDAMPPGEYAGELRVTVYDAALNEDSIYRNVNVQTCPQSPWVAVEPSSLSQEIFVADTAEPDILEVWNRGCAGGTLSYSIAPNVSWMHVEPSSGVSDQDPPTTNVHTVTYDHLPPGTHSGSIVITGSHNVVTVNVTITVNTVASDFDKDGDVDQKDFGAFQVCFTGTTPVSGACVPMDLNNDMYVNWMDLPIFKDCMSGWDVYPDPDCGQ